MDTTYDEIMSLFREVAEAQKDVSKTLKEVAEEQKALTEAQKDTDRRFKDTDRKLNQLEQLFTSQWGRLMEALVEGDLVRLLTERGIAIADTTTRLKGKRPDGGNYEFDIIAHNGEVVVVVEVKTTLRPDDVKDFLNKLNHLKTWIPRYAGNRLYGAMAWLTADAGAEAMVENRGLYSIRATGDSASILNAAEFRPRAW
ncbi:hypothetical protein [Halochromatium glycolicum]|jgi:Holliday junction resolvase-like predicted endonuclease|uniref:hypothetical protein n=1 Tax=Halochromatium glycolicum TaxID=85075 RepID=UPI001F5BBCA8|nr:hypothetical protein [Halochromatium glycolicum]